jgi:hypothetical protein
LVVGRRPRCGIVIEVNAIQVNANGHLSASPARSPGPGEGAPTCRNGKIRFSKEDEMSKEPKVDHDYHAGKDKLTITIHRYSLKNRKTRDDILEKLMATLESNPDRLIAGARKRSKTDRTRSCQQKTSKLIEVGD